MDGGELLDHRIFVYLVSKSTFINTTFSFTKNHRFKNLDLDLKLE